MVTQGVETGVGLDAGHRDPLPRGHGEELFKKIQGRLDLFIGPEVAWTTFGDLGADRDEIDAATSSIDLSPWFTHLGFARSF